MSRTTFTPFAGSTGKKFATATRRSIRFANNTYVIKPNPPAVTVVSPSSGTTITTSTVITFTISSPVQQPLKFCFITASFPTQGIYEVIFDGISIGTSYAGSTATPLTYTQNGTTYTYGYSMSIAKVGGWPATPSIIVNGIDIFDQSS